MTDVVTAGGVADAGAVSLTVDGRVLRLGELAVADAVVVGPATVRTWSSREHGLDVRIRVQRFGADAAEWSIELVNTEARVTATLADLNSLDVVLPWGAGGGAVTLSSANGSKCQLDDFLPFQRELVDGQPVHLEPVGGRSSDGAFPFFAVGTDTRSYAVAVGWSGQWRADLNHFDGGTRVTVGLAHARLRLNPGETISLPSILLVGAHGGPTDATAALRDILWQHYVPRQPDGSPVTPMAHMTMSTFHVTHEVYEAGELAAVAAAADLGLEAYWVDACWYGDTPMWAEQVGSWVVRKDAFPNGLAPIGAAAHARGMKFVVWFEPERARVGTRWPSEHPEQFLAFPDDPDNLLLNLGCEDARQAAFALLSGYIDDFGVDIYRQDFNIAPLPAWQAADAPDRIGITEIRHVEGLYWLWDRLLERHPGLVIDNCASGGRRIDLETMKRSVPLWRSDAADVGGGAKGASVSLANQVQTGGLSPWVPEHTGPIWAFDPFETRSACSTGFVVYRPLPADDQGKQALRAAVAETRRLRPFLAGRLQHLTPVTMSQADWSATQYHRDDSGAGFAIALRRFDSTESDRALGLGSLDPDRRYRVTISADYDLGPVQEMTGAQLGELNVRIPTVPGSVLVEYQPLATPTSQ